MVVHTLGVEMRRCLFCLLPVLLLLGTVSGQDSDRKIVALEQQVANLTEMVNLINAELNHHKTRIAFLEECECLRKCVYEGIERRHNSTWLQDICTSCSCQDGRVICTPLVDNPRCLEGCVVNNTLYDNNETFERDPCTTCVCKAGEVKCNTSQCPILPCLKNVTLTGQCCPQCLSCRDRGRVISYGRVYRPDACTQCICGDNAPLSTCTVQSCPNVSCIGTPIVSRRECCPVCKDCPPHGNGEAWVVDECTNCTCEQGEETCVNETCPFLNCSHSVTIEGRCCLSCEAGTLLSVFVVLSFALS
ncbi:kielin/chordin-like protein [Corticium candelabrum]|uniref:kielin/chordin-like protein n=1 Tax=Corticium candelabrum TaxID=121492 RepID=UPI002E25A534|nr:kielin/chordin-like protein [Corticium candelabrum]